MTDERGEKHFERWVEKPAKLHLPTPAYFASRLPAHTVNPDEQRPWHENAKLCAKRDLKQMIPGSRMNINGHIVKRHENQSRLPYQVGSTRYTLDEAVAAVCATA